MSKEKWKLKKNQIEIQNVKSTITEMKKSRDGLNSGFEMSEERIKKLKMDQWISVYLKNRNKRGRRKVNRASVTQETMSNAPVYV